MQIVFDATDANTTNIAIGYAQGVVALATADLDARWTAAHGIRPSDVGVVDLEPRVWFNEGLDSRNFIIPGVVAVILALVGAQLTSLTVSREWERGTMEQLVSTPVTPLEVMIGQAAAVFPDRGVRRGVLPAGGGLLVRRAVPRQPRHSAADDGAVHSWWCWRSAI